MARGSRGTRQTRAVLRESVRGVNVSPANLIFGDQLDSDFAVAEFLNVTAAVNAVVRDWFAVEWFPGGGEVWQSAWNNLRLVFGR
jgi:hypothetical protein